MGNNADFYKIVNESYQHGGQGLHNVLFHVVILLDCSMMDIKTALNHSNQSSCG